MPNEQKKNKISYIKNINIKFNPPIWLYYLVFTVSGFSGLIYESIWSHYLKLFLGHAALAQSLVLMIFMGGMALGAFWASRFSEKIKSPILVYILIEAIIGIAALLFHGVFTNLIDFFYTSLLPSLGSPVTASLLKWFAASLLILPQSILLGMTFPLMTAGILRRYPKTPGASISTLYFSNSIGAAIGVLTSGFFMIKAFGLPGTIFTAGVLNLALALFTWILLRVDISTPELPKPLSTPTSEKFRWESIFLITAAITGAASFIYEIAWIRMLSMVLGSTTHSFELMLSAFITGLALGGLWIRKRIDNIKSPIKFLAKVQLIMGILAVATIPVYIQSFDWMSDIVLTINANSEKGYLFFILFSHTIALLVMLPTTFLAGMTLPLITHVLLQNDVGEKSIGRVYSANTAGAIIGVLFAIHLGLPLLGLKHLMIAGASLDIALGIFILYKLVKPKKKIDNLPLTLSSITAILFVGFFINMDTKLLTSGVYRHGTSNYLANYDVLFYRDGKTATIAFAASKDGIAGVFTNGKPDAAITLDSTKKERQKDEITMTLLGSLPLAYNPEATNIANIGMGSGMTTHTLLADKSLHVVDTIEIEESIVMGSKLFADNVSRAYDDPRSQIHINDAKTFFSVNNKKYDIIIAEPSNPWVSGVSSLFSYEFYRSITNYITHNGLFVQWIQLYEFDDALLLSILSALGPNFSDYLIYNIDSTNLLIVAKKDGSLGAPDWGRIFNGDMQNDLAKQQIFNENDLQVRYIANKEIMQSLFTLNTPTVNSDYYPYVDLNAGKARFMRSTASLPDDLSNAPLPVIDVLNKTSLDYANVTESSFLNRVSYISEARLISRYFLSNESVDDQADLNGTALQSITNVKLINKKCGFKEHADSWGFAANNIVMKTLAYVDKQTANEIIEALRGTDCPIDSHTELQKAKLDFYAAVGARNPQALIDTGTALFEFKQQLYAEDYNYVASGILLGYVSTKNFEQAKTFYQEHLSTNTTEFGAEPYQQLLLGLINVGLARNVE